MLRDYWNIRYGDGGDSGIGSIGKEKDWKWSIIKEEVDITTCSVLDLGCGDLSFWRDFRAKKYIGIDYSSFIIERNRAKFPELDFHLMDMTTLNRSFAADVIFCLDVLFHQPSKRDFEAILDFLNNIDGEFLFITNFDTRLPQPAPHMSFRNLTDYLDRLSNWILQKVHDSPFDSKKLYFLKRGLK